MAEAQLRADPVTAFHRQHVKHHHALPTAAIYYPSGIHSLLNEQSYSILNARKTLA